jgi:hypothetical protein
MHRTSTRLTTYRFGRRAFGLAVLGALALSACSDEQSAEFDPAGGTGGSDGGGGSASDAAAADLPPLEPGLVVEEFTKEVTVADTLQPTAGTVITPTGTLSIEGVQELSSVPGEAVDQEPETGEDGEELEFAAAPGEVLRALDLTFTATSEDLSGEGAGTPLTDISIRAGGAQTHLAEIDGGYENRLLVSVPQDGSAMLVISCDGHDQLVDLLTGERQEDDVAAAYYREGRVQEPHHTFPIQVDSIPVLRKGAADGEVTSEVALQAETLTLTAWTPENGWAEPGGAWLVLGWSSSIGLTSLRTGLVSTNGYTVTASLTVDGETTTDEISEDRVPFGSPASPATSTLVAPVSVDTTTATVSMSGSFSLEISEARTAYSLDGSGDREFSSEELAIGLLADGSAPSAQPSDGGGD